MDLSKAHKFLDAKKAAQKLDRIAFQILENNYLADQIVLLGIEPGGNLMVDELVVRIKRASNKELIIGSIFVDKPNPSIETIKLSDEKIDFENKAVVIVDDVGNSGKTLFYALQLFHKKLPKSIQIAILVDRMHKRFPIKADFVGFPLATTIHEHVIVQFENKKIEGAYLF